MPTEATKRPWRADSGYVRDFHGHIILASVTTGEAADAAVDLTVRAVNAHDTMLAALDGLQCQAECTCIDENKHLARALRPLTKDYACATCKARAAIALAKGGTDAD